MDEPNDNEVTAQDVTADVVISDETTTPTSAPSPDGGNDLWTNKSEFVQWAKKTRENGKGLALIGDRLGSIERLLEQKSSATSQQPSEDGNADSAPQPTLSQIRNEDMDLVIGRRIADIEFREALAEIDHPLTKTQKGMMLRLYRAERPDLEDLSEWLTANASIFKADKAGEQPKVETPTATPPQAPNVTNTGAPAADPRSAIPVDIFQADAEAWKSLSPKEKIERFEGYKRSKGVEGNPFAARKTTQ